MKPEDALLVLGLFFLTIAVLGWLGDRYDAARRDAARRNHIRRRG